MLKSEARVSFLFLRGSWWMVMGAGQCCCIELGTEHVEVALYCIRRTKTIVVREHV